MKNRIIKFRIWSMDQFYYKCLVGNTTDTNDTNWTCPMVYHNENWVHCDNGVIQQFTGLHDKNGKEIYEGDIIEYAFDFDNEKLKKKSKKYIGVVKYHQPHCSFQLCKPSNENGFVFNAGHFCVFEIIGNIYEHPNLITDASEK